MEGSLIGATMFSLVLGDTEDCKNHSGPWSDEWPLNSRVDLMILPWPRGTILPMLVNEPMKYLNLTKTTLQEWLSCWIKGVMKIHSLLHLLHNSRC